ncbi:hypothetical protein [Burkholderia gladioli]|uniref:hypothetical protein n=1 Tax=Burkholderia gladioli TaxID=28095 RepID=UPI000F52F6F1|nr:hypothetical protein [Burkholderia gladioli]
MTTAKYAIVLNSVVENIVLWDGDYETWTPPDGSTAHLLPDGSAVNIGDTFDDAPPSSQSAATT